MNWKNPTGINIGMTGHFVGHRFRVAGRAILSVMDAGRTYYWHEFYLQDEQGNFATLVYEKAGITGEWRWFKIFDPQAPISAADAAMKRQGDYVTIDDNTAQVMLTRESMVCHVEGHAPEGVRAGAHANYFNAKDGSALFVVSWTGDEVEFYRGMNLSRSAVAVGFGLKSAQLVPFETGVRAALAVLAVFIVLIVMAGMTSGPSTRGDGISTIALNAPPLKVGAHGNLNGTDYRIAGYKKVEIAETDSILIRHEYLLRDADGGDALLVYGGIGAGNYWWLFTPIQAMLALTPREAAAAKWGGTLLIGGTPTKITELFRSTTLESEATNGLKSFAPDVHYGLLGRAGANQVLARWNEQDISLSMGKRVQGRDVLTAFGPMLK